MRRHNKKNLRDIVNIVSIAGIAAAFSFPPSAIAQDNVDASNAETINVEAQPLADALKAFSDQTGLQLAYVATLAQNKASNGVENAASPVDALDAILESTGLEYQFVNDDTVAIGVADEQRGDRDAKKRMQTLVLLSQTATSREATGSEDAPADGDAGESANAANDPQDFEEIVVTGSQLINDPGKLTRQMTIFNRAEIERSGATRLDEFLSRLPQNMNAPNNVGSGFAQGEADEPTYGLGDNVFAGSSINLRGLGSQYTLILIDGRRPARGGQFGSIVDISNIPIDRIERIEILFDGAAAIYGADAVGGVVNIITRREYDGTTLTAAYNATEEGGGARYNLQLGRTFNWKSGSLTASVTYQTQEQIDGAQRPGIILEDSSINVFGEDFFLRPSLNGNVRGQRAGSLVDGEIVFSFAPLMWVNGDQRLSGGVEVPVLRQVSTSTGIEFVETTTIVDRQNPVLGAGMFWIDEAAHRPQDPETLGFTPVFQADLPDYSGQPLGLAELSASGELGADVFVPFEGLAVSPEDETYSIALDFNQDISDTLGLSLSLAYTDTYKASNNLGNDSTVIILADSPSNPFLRQFDFAFENEFPQQFQEVKAQSYSATGGIDWDFAKGWSLAFGFGVSERKAESDTANFLRKNGFGPDTLEARLQGYYKSQPGSSRPREFTGSHFNDPTLGYGSIEAMMDALVVPFMQTRTYSESYDADIRLLGKLFTLPGGDVRSSLSLRYREDRSEIFDNNPLIGNFAGNPLDTAAIGSSGYDDSFGEHVTGVAAELSVPVFGDDFRLPLVDRLLLSLSGSLEDYSNTDENGFNWAAGFNWGLTQNFVVRLNRTYSLRVPDSVRMAREPEWGWSDSGFYVYNNIDDDVASVLVNEVLWKLGGGADHLVPEQNYGTALSFIYRPSFVKGLDMELNITESNTVDQIGNPWMGKWTVDTLAPEAVRSNPLFAYADPENNPVHAAAVGFTFFGEPVGMQPGELIYDARQYNVADTFNRGADLQVSYTLNTGFGDWLLTWRHQYLDVNRVTRSNICEQVEAGCNHVVPTRIGGDRGYGVPINTVGSVTRDNFSNLYALPRNRGSIELVWGYRGLGMTLATTYQETTSVVKTKVVTEQVIVDYIEFNGIRIPIFEEQIRTNILREDSRPARAVDFTLSYDFGKGGLFDAPGWLENAHLWLTVNGLYRGERKQTVTYLQQEHDFPEPADINRLAVNPRGRAYSLRFSNTF